MGLSLMVDMKKRPYARGDAFRHRYGPMAKNEGPCSVFLSDGRWLMTWSQGTGPAYPDERVVGAFSEDMGKTWSEPATIVASDPQNELHVPHAIPFVVERTGRVYLFFCENINTDAHGWLANPGFPLDGADRRFPEHGSGRLCFIYSDDSCRTWSERREIALPHREIYSLPDRIHAWLSHPPQVMPTGEVVFTFTGYQADLGLGYDLSIDWRLRPSEANLVVCDNLLAERDPDALHFTLLPEGPQGIRLDVSRHLSNQPLRRFHDIFFGEPAIHGSSFEEATVVALNDGRWLMVGRTKLGCPCFAVSKDRGHTWTSPEPLRYSPSGPTIPNPMTLCPMAKMSDGRYILLFTNNNGSSRGATHIWDADRARNPQWIVMASETNAEANGGLWFGSPMDIAEAADGRTRQDQTRGEISMPQFVERKGQAFVAYSVKRRDILLDELPPAILEALTPRW